MRLRDLFESIDFHASERQEKNGRTHIVPHGQRKVEVDCYACEGTGKDQDENCRYCQGRKKQDDWVTDSPHLNASNDNAHAIITKLLGLEYDEAGVIEHKDLHEVQRRLIKMLNSEKERSALHKDDVVHRSKMGVHGKKDNVVSIGRKGPFLYDFGRTDEQVLRYARTLLSIVEYAIKHNLVVSWA